MTDLKRGFYWNMGAIAVEISMWFTFRIASKNGTAINQELLNTIHQVLED